MPLTEDLTRWESAGLIDEATAEAITAFESARVDDRRVGRGLEAVAYLGAVLILVAAGVLVFELWDQMEPWGHLTLSTLVAVALFVAGVFLGRSEEPALIRARTFAWLLAVAAVALTAQVGISEFTGAEEQDVFLWVSVVSLIAAVGLWWPLRTALQLIAVGVTSAASTLAVLAQFDPEPDWAFGVVFAVPGAAWIALTWAGILEPRRTGYAIGGVGTLLIAFPEFGELPWPLLGLGVGLALLAISVRLKENVLLGLGVAGLFVYIPMSTFELFGESLGVPVALLITGLALLGVVIVTVRLRKDAAAE